MCITKCAFRNQGQQHRPAAGRDERWPQFECPDDAHLAEGRPGSCWAAKAEILPPPHGRKPTRPWLVRKPEVTNAAIQINGKRKSEINTWPPMRNAATVEKIGAGAKGMPCSGTWNGASEKDHRCPGRIVENCCISSPLARQCCGPLGWRWACGFTAAPGPGRRYA